MSIAIYGRYGHAQSHSRRRQQDRCPDRHLSCYLSPPIEQLCMCVCMCKSPLGDTQEQGWVYNVLARDTGIMPRIIMQRAWQILSTAHTYTCDPYTTIHVHMWPQNAAFGGLWVLIGFFLKIGVLRRILKLPPVFKSLFRGISVLPVFREIRDIYPLWMFLVVLPNFQVQPYIAICGHRMMVLVVSHTAICGHTQPQNPYFQWSRTQPYVAIHSHSFGSFSI